MENRASMSFNYMAEAQLTLSDKFHGHKVPLQHFINVVDECIASLNRLDKIKKAMFYGRDLGLTNIGESQYTDCRAMPSSFKGVNEQEAANIIHGIIGIATEAGELLELLSKTAIEQIAFDSVNAEEETGDTMWYQAILLAAIGSNFNGVQHQNIAKLRQRFPNNFTEYDANNRDLFSERDILESNAANQK